MGLPHDKEMKAHLGPAGGHLVMAELLRRGYVAALTPLGMEGIDILVLEPESCSIQVKTTARGERWCLRRKDETPITKMLFDEAADL